MKSFTYERVDTPAAATASFARNTGSRFIAGGTNLLDLMKLEIETPGHLIDVSWLGLDKIEPTSEGGVRIGAMVRNTDLAADARIRREPSEPIAVRPMRGGAPAVEQTGRGEHECPGADGADSRDAGRLPPDPVEQRPIFQ